MSAARGRALLIICTLVIAAALLFAGSRREPQEWRRRAQRPALLLLTGLPLLFSEDFSLKPGDSDVVRRLRQRYRLVPLSVSSAPELAKGRLLLMAQPLAQTPENLVALDDWVRAGGRVLLLADPLLEWPSKRALGDPLRPPPLFADTGLLAHWGLRLDAPDQRGPALRSLAGERITTVSPGALYGACAVSADRLVADCQLGKGRAVIVADADLLDVAELGPNAPTNLDALATQLATLEKPAIR